MFSKDKLEAISGLFLGDTTPPTFTNAQLGGHVPASSFQATQGQVLSFSGTVSDNVALQTVTVLVTGPRGSNLTVTSRSVSGSSLSLSSFSFDTGNPTYAGAPGNYTVALWAKDTSGLPSSLTWNFGVTAPDTTPPTFANAQLGGHVPASSFQATQGQVLAFSGTASDNVALQAVTVLVTGPKGSDLFVTGLSPGSASLSLSSFSFDTGNPTYAGAPGNYTVVLRAKDVAGNTATQTWTFGVTAAASFAGSNATAGGSWKGLYGTDGYKFIGDASANGSSLPSYVASVDVTGPLSYVWESSSTNPAALQKSAAGSTDRVAATWFGPTMDFDVHFTDTATHRVAVYALDYNANRSESVSLIDDASGAVLDTRSLSGMLHGKWLVWDVAGSVTIRVSSTGPTDAVVSGLFFGASTPATAGFVTTNTTAQGNWKNIYGIDGYQFVGDASAGGSKLPAYVASITTLGANSYVWEGSSTNPAALRKSDVPGDRVAAVWYGTSMSFDVRFTDAAPHRLALYALDYNANRSESVSLIDDATGAVLDTRSLSGMLQGKWLVWDVTRSVTIVVTNTGPTDAVVSGLFFGAAAPATASYVATDATTGGTWKGVYGGDGYEFIGDPSAAGASLPSYVSSVGVGGALSYVWESSSTNPAALQKSTGAADRVAATWFGASMTFDVHFTDAATHRVAVYALDYNANRSESVSIVDDATGAVLDTRPLSNMLQGKWLVWDVTRSVTIVVTNTGPTDGVLSGIFFGDGGIVPSYSLRESVAIPSGYSELFGVGDADGDGTLDVALRKPGSLAVAERSGASFATKFTASAPRAVGFGDVDGDGRPEILGADFGSATIYEASGNDAYRVVGTDAGYSIIEGNVRIGDSNGNGRREFLVPDEAFPTRIHIIEGNGDNSYTSLGSVTGLGGNCSLAGVRDLDGDGLPEIVFHDDQYSATRRTYVYEAGSLIYQAAGFACMGLGDTDGNGRQEIIGVDTATGNLVVQESDGNNHFSTVLNAPNTIGFGDFTSQNPFVQDVDGDGRGELISLSNDSDGVLDVLHLWKRSGGTIQELWNSGDMLRGVGGAISSVLAVGDTNGDGRPELAVLQGQKLHFLELQSAMLPGGSSAAGRIAPTGTTPVALSSLPSSGIVQAAATLPQADAEVQSATTQAPPEPTSTGSGATGDAFVAMTPNYVDKAISSASTYGTAEEDFAGLSEVGIGPVTAKADHHTVGVSKQDASGHLGQGGRTQAANASRSFAQVASPRTAASRSAFMNRDRALEELMTIDRWT